MGTKNQDKNSTEETHPQKKKKKSRGPKWFSYPNCLTGKFRPPVLDLPSLCLDWWGYTQIGDGTEIIEVQNRVQRQGDFMDNSNIFQWVVFVGAICRYLQHFRNMERSCRQPQQLCRRGMTIQLYQIGGDQLNCLTLYCIRNRRNMD
jgi:hypothetical protein